MAVSATRSSPNNWLLKLENQLCFPLYAMSRMLTKVYQPYLQALGLTYPWYLVLLLLWEHEELTVKELGTRLLSDSRTLTLLLKRMEQKQWLSRRDPRDERFGLIGLLPAGRALHESAVAIPGQLFAKLNLAPAELAALHLQPNTALTRLA